MPKLLDSRKKQVARLLVAGRSQVEIARAIGTHKSTVCRLMKDPAVVDEVSKLQNFADMNVAASVPGIPEKLREKAHQAVDILSEILQSEKTDLETMKLKMHAALEILSRCGHAPVKQVQIKASTVSTHLTLDEIAALKARAKEIAQESGLAVPASENPNSSSDAIEVSPS